MAQAAAQPAGQPGDAGPAAMPASARDCSRLLRRLGYVTIFAFSHDSSDDRFMVVGRDGQRIARPTLTAALSELLRRSDRASRPPPAAGAGPRPWPEDEL